MEANGNTQGAKTQETKAQAAGEEDLSMEEILQSIRRIIAEDDTEGKKPVADAKNGAKAKANTDDVPGSDVLELTEMLKDDGSVVSLKAEAAPAAAKPAATASADVLNKIDEALTPAKTMEKTPPKIEEKPAAPAAPAAAAPPAKAPADSLLSTEAATAANASFKKLQTVDSEPPPVVTTPAPAFRSGGTVEDMVAEMLRPLMKEWLDANLPAIVERVVEREVKKLTR